MDFSKFLMLGNGGWQRIYDRSPILFVFSVVLAATVVICLFWFGIWVSQELTEMFMPVGWEVTL